MTMEAQPIPALTPPVHTAASHSDQAATGAELEELTDGSDSALHTHGHTAASHSDQAATGAELEELTDGSDSALHTHGHTAASHSDQSATGAELNSLTDDSDTITIHRHAVQSTSVAATRTAVAGAGTQNITGAGFAPTAAVVFFAGDGGNRTAAAWGFVDDANAELTVFHQEASTFNDAGILGTITDGTNAMQATSGALTADGIDIAWIKYAGGLDVGMVILFLR
jgi:hypothetical protein